MKDPDLSVESLDASTRIIFIQRSSSTGSKCYESAKLTLTEASTFIKERIRANSDPNVYWTMKVF